MPVKSSTGIHTRLATSSGDTRDDAASDERDGEDGANDPKLVRGRGGNDQAEDADTLMRGSRRCSRPCALASSSASSACSTALQKTGESALKKIHSVGPLAVAPGPRARWQLTPGLLLPPFLLRAARGQRARNQRNQNDGAGAKHGGERIAHRRPAHKRRRILRERRGPQGGEALQYPAAAGRVAPHRARPRPSSRRACWLGEIARAPFTPGRAGGQNAQRRQDHEQRQRRPTADARCATWLCVSGRLLRRLRRQMRRAR